MTAGDTGTAIPYGGVPTRGWVRRWFEAAVDLLYPPRCVSCARELEPPTPSPRFCAACDKNLALIAEPACLRCASRCSQVDLELGDCFRCRGKKLRFQAARAIGSYQDELQDAVLRAKHVEYEPLAGALGQRLAQRLVKSPFVEQPEIVVAVPMHWLKRIWRRTNPAETVAQTVARHLQIPMAKGALLCRRYLERQALLSIEDRRRNVRGAFHAARFAKVAGKRVLLVDDVMTTGATADECCRALLAAGAAAVFVATVSRAAPE